MSLDERRQRLKIAERWRPHAEPVRIGRFAIADNEVADLPFGGLDRMVCLACWRLDEPRNLADNLSFRDTFDCLPDDPHRLPELLEPDEIPIVGVAGGADRHFELHLVVRRVWLVLAHVLGNAGAAQRWPAEPDSGRLVARDHADAFRAFEPDSVVREQLFVLVQ